MNWKRVGEIVLDSGHVLIVRPSAADVRSDSLWDEVMRLADSGGQMWSCDAGVLALLPYEGTYLVEARGEGTEFELRLRYVT